MELLIPNAALLLVIHAIGNFLICLLGPKQAKRQTIHFYLPSKMFCMKFDRCRIFIDNGPDRFGMCCLQQAQLFRDLIGKLTNLTRTARLHIDIILCMCVLALSVQLVNLLVCICTNIYFFENL